MSHEAVTYALDHSRASGRALLALIALADRCVHRASGDHRWRGPFVCWPGFEQLATRCRVQSRRQVSRLLVELKNLGEIEELTERVGRLKTYKLTGFARYCENRDGTTDVSLTSPECPPTPPSTGHSGHLDGTFSSPLGDISRPLGGHSRASIGTEEQKEQKGNGEPPPVELPDRFPKSPEQAIAWTLASVPDDFVRQWWSEAAGHGGRDPYTGKPIENWAFWINAKFARHRSRETTQGFGKKRAPSETALRIELEQLEKDIDAMPGRPGSSMIPTPEQQSAYRAAKKRRQELLTQLSEARHSDAQTSAM